MNVQVSGAPSDEEVAAIVAALEALWPRAAAPAALVPSRVPTWRFSNRWWVKPLASRRERPRR